LFTNSLFCDIPQNKEQRTGPHHIWCTHTLCPLFGRRGTNTDRSGVGLTILLAGACCGDSQFKTFSAAALGLQTNGGGGAILALSGFLNQIPHQK
jgi:hypothetical protein